jgi:DNA-binding GntR family transcriptional regulator
MVSLKPTQVFDALRARLIDGTITPGSKLNERELCETLGTSRTPLREAVRTLAAQGFVTLVPNRGAFATALSADDAAHAFEVIAALEAQSGALAAQRATAEELAEIRALHFEMRAHHARRNLRGYYDANAKIHACINRAAKNPMLTQLYDTVNARLQGLRFRSNVDHEKWDRAVAEHDDILLALEKKDGKKLSALLTAHLNAKRDVVLAQLQAGATKPKGKRHAA